MDEDTLFFQALNSLGADNLLTIIALLILSVQDIKYGEIHYRYLLMMVGFSYPSAYIILVLTLIFYKYLEDYIGGADLLIFCLLISRYSYIFTYRILFVSSLLALIYCLIFKKQRLKFIPFIFLAFLVCLKGVL